MAIPCTQPYTLQLRPYCPGNSFYLRWLGPLGNWEAWLFDGDYDPSAVPQAGTVFQPEQGVAQVLRRLGVNRLLVRAGSLTPAQHEGLTTLLDSPQVYIQEATGTLTPVLVTATPAGRTSSDSRTTFDVELTLGPRNPLTRI